ncbi:MAG: Crp/Fnr family transcriptional regulator [Acidimicrobiia bacterium]
MTLGAASSYLVWEKDSFVFEAGQPSEGIFIIVGGSVDIIEPDGALVAQLEPGQIFGEISAIFGTAHTKSARVTERSELVFVPRDALDVHMEENPHHAQRLRELVQTRLAES